MSTFLAFDHIIFNHMWDTWYRLCVVHVPVTIIYSYVPNILLHSLYMSIYIWCTRNMFQVLCFFCVHKKISFSRIYCCRYRFPRNLTKIQNIQSLLALVCATSWLVTNINIFCLWVSICYVLFNMCVVKFYIDYPTKCLWMHWFAISPIVVRKIRWGTNLYMVFLCNICNMK